MTDQEFTGGTTHPEFDVWWERFGKALMKDDRITPYYMALAAWSVISTWKDAVIDALVVDWIYTKEHDDNPRKAIDDLLAWQQKLALDPAVSKEAHDLYEQIRILSDGLSRAQMEQIIDEFRIPSTAYYAGSGPPEHLQAWQSALQWAASRLEAALQQATTPPARSDGPSGN